jgi:hypothetical protein
MSSARALGSQVGPCFIYPEVGPPGCSGRAATYKSPLDTGEGGCAQVGGWGSMNWLEPRRTTPRQVLPFDRNYRQPSLL